MDVGASARVVAAARWSVAAWLVQWCVVAWLAYNELAVVALGLFGLLCAAPLLDRRSLAPRSLGRGDPALVLAPVWLVPVVLGVMFTGLPHLLAFPSTWIVETGSKSVDDQAAGGIGALMGPILAVASLAFYALAAAGAGRKDNRALRWALAVAVVLALVWFLGRARMSGLGAVALAVHLAGAWVLLARDGAARPSWLAVPYLAWTAVVAAATGIDGRTVNDLNWSTSLGSALLPAATVLVLRRAVQGGAPRWSIAGLAGLALATGLTALDYTLRGFGLPPFVPQPLVAATNWAGLLFPALLLATIWPTVSAWRGGRGPRPAPRSPSPAA